MIDVKSSMMSTLPLLDKNHQTLETLCNFCKMLCEITHMMHTLNQLNSMYNYKMNFFMGWVYCKRQFLHLKVYKKIYLAMTRLYSNLWSVFWSLPPISARAFSNPTCLTKTGSNNKPQHIILQKLMKCSSTTFEEEQGRTSSVQNKFFHSHRWTINDWAFQRDSISGSGDIFNNNKVAIFRFSTLPNTSRVKLTDVQKT